MKKIVAFLKLIRPANIVLTIIGVSLGFVISGATSGYMSLLLLIGAAVCSAAYGNIINDIKDFTADSINRPDRPLPHGDLSRRFAQIAAGALSAVSLICGFCVSNIHGFGTLIPIILLTLYTLFLKGTPLSGNIIVSLLVGYVLIFGALGTPHTTIVYIPALLAFLLNLAREIIKTLEDDAGDRAAGYTTTAHLRRSTINQIVGGISVLYCILVTLPYVFHQFGKIYLMICLCAVLPLHGLWNSSYFFSLSQGRLGRASLIIKIEMLSGLLSLAVDFYL